MRVFSTKALSVNFFSGMLLCGNEAQFTVCYVWENDFFANEVGLDELVCKYCLNAWKEKVKVN